MTSKLARHAVILTLCAVFRRTKNDLGGDLLRG